MLSLQQLPSSQPWSDHSSSSSSSSGTGKPHGLACNDDYEQDELDNFDAENELFVADAKNSKRDADTENEQYDADADYENDADADT